MSRLPRLRLMLLAATATLSASTAPASAANFVLEDWHGSTGLAWQQGSATDFIGWESTSSDGTFNFAKVDLTGRRSLFAEAQFLPQQAPGTGEWRFVAPGTSTITKAEYGAAYFTKEGCLNEGMRLANGTWQTTRNARLGEAAAVSVHPTACGANATVTGAPVTTKDGSTAVTITGAPGRQTFCSTAGCGLAGSPTGNQAVFGAERIRQGRPGFGVALPGARLTLTDYDAPRLTGGTNTHPRWVRSARGTVTITSTDTGLGVKAASVTHAALSGDTSASQTHPCSGDRTDRCPATWNAPRREWITSWPYDTDQMPEGVQPYGAVLTDIVENRAPATGTDTSVVPPSKIDRSDPTDITGSGEIPALDGKWFLGNDTRTITASAHDTYSGVQRVQIETTTGEILDSATFDCGDDQCPRDITKTLAVDTTKLPEGDTVVRLRATDLVGNTAVGRTWTLRIDRSDPTDVAGTGSLPSSDGVWTLGNDTRAVHATAHDRYSGVKKLQLEKVNGDVVDSATFTCDDGRQCEHDDAANLSLDLSTLPEGDTQVRLRATDLLDHTAVGPVWTLRVDRSVPSSINGAGELPSLDGGYVNGHTPVTVDATATDDLSGVHRVELVDGSGAVIASLPVDCATQCPTSAAGVVPFNSSSLLEGTHLLHLRVTDRVGLTTDSGEWSLVVDTSGPAFAASLEGGLAPDAGSSLVEWDPASDPDLADGTGGSGTARYRMRYRTNAASPWSDVIEVADMRTAVPIVATQLDVELSAIDQVGNLGPAATVTVAGYEQDPMPMPEGTPDTDDDEGVLEDDITDPNESGGALNEEYGVASRATHTNKVHHYTCRSNAYGPIQAWPSGFVFGTCKPGTEVRSWDQAVWKKTTKADGSPGGYPGALSEGWEWAGVALPPQSTFDGCGWMSTAKRVSLGGDDDTPRCAKVSYRLGDFVHAKTTKSDAPRPNSKYPGMQIWATKQREVVKDSDGNVVKNPDGTDKTRIKIGSDGKPVEIDGKKWNSKGDNCQAYANINPWKSGQTAREAIRVDGELLKVNKGDEIKIRYMAKWSAVNPETDNRVLWVLAHTSEPYAPWVWLSAPCIF